MFAGIVVASHRMEDLLVPIHAIIMVEIRYTLLKMSTIQYFLNVMTFILVIGFFLVSSN